MIQPKNETEGFFYFQSLKIVKRLFNKLIEKHNKH